MIKNLDDDLFDFSPPVGCWMAGPMDNSDGCLQIAPASDDLLPEDLEDLEILLHEFLYGEKKLSNSP